MTAEAYREFVQQAWRGGALKAEDLSRLRQAQIRLAINAESAAAIERQVMGMTKEEAGGQAFRSVAGGAVPGEPMLAPSASGSGSYTISNSVTSFGPELSPGGGFHGQGLGGELPKTMGRGRYHVLELLGQGGMGRVFKVFDTRLGEVRALKAVNPGQAANREAGGRLKREVRVSQKLRHPGIVQVFDYEYDEDAECDFITMEFVQGVTLRVWMDAHRGNQIPMDSVSRIVGQIIEAVDYAHKHGVVHLDLKPENVVVDLGQGCVRILDFGIARDVGCLDAQSLSSKAGTPNYMAPEQERGGLSVGCPADVYSIGCIVYEMLVGTSPRGAVQAPHCVRHDVGHVLGDIVMASMHVDPAMRPPIGLLRDCVGGSGDTIPAKIDRGLGEDAELALSEFEKTYWSTRPVDRGALLARNAVSHIQTWRAAAEQGRTFAEYLMGSCAMAGIAMTQDKKCAVDWLRKCADKQHAAAMHDLGLAYLCGDGVDQEPSIACQWFLAAAERGYAYAQYEMGLAYYKGLGVPQSLGEAIRWYRNAAYQGEPRAQYCLGCAIHRGEGVATDHFEAFRWWQQSALSEHGESMLRMALCYQEGHGVEKNPGEAIAWFRKAGAQGLVEAQVRLAWAYRSGHGVSQDVERAREWFEKAACQGNADAQFEFGREDSWQSEQSKQWLKKAAEQGHEAAIRELKAREPVVPQKSDDDFEAFLTWVVGVPTFVVGLWVAYHVGSWILGLLGWLIGVVF